MERLVPFNLIVKVKLFWDDNSYNKEVKATYSKEEKNYSLSNLNLINLENLTVEDSFADGFKKSWK